MNEGQSLSEYLAEMKKVDFRTVDAATLVDINDVVINMALPKEERLLDYIRQIKNPYCYKCGQMVVGVTFADTDMTLEDCMKNYFDTL